MAQSVDLERITQALAVGRLAVADPSGYQRTVYARCPKDGRESPGYRTERSGEAITRVVFRCPACTTQFDAKAEDMFLR